MQLILMTTAAASNKAQPADHADLAMQAVRQLLEP
jgi:hypothetical protein